MGKALKIIIGAIAGLVILGVTVFVVLGFIKKKESPLPLSKTPAVSYSQMVNSHFSQEDPGVGTHWKRLWISWGGIEKTQGKFNFSEIDHLIISGQQKEDIVFLITVFPYADWDQDECHDDSYAGKIPMPDNKMRGKVGKPCQMTRYRNFLRKLVERYDGDGTDDVRGLKYPIKHWEIMNEPSMQGNDPSGLKFFKGSPQDYLEILKASYQVIKEADSSAKVIMGGMAGMHSKFVEFWRPIMKEAVQYFDIANIHSIDTTSSREDLFVFKFKQFLSQFSADNKPIWITEAQFGSLQEKWTDPAQIVRSAVISLSLGADKIFFISENWSKNVLKAYKVLAKKLNYFGALQTINHRYRISDNNTEGVSSQYGLFKFKVKDKTIYVAWGNVDLVKYLGNSQVKVTDIFGNEEIKEINQIKLTSSPVYIEPIQQPTS